jgi:hypothetical protein
MRVAFMRDASKNCYQDKWMSDDMPNEPQVTLCKSETYEKYFGKWDDQLYQRRETAEYRLKDCIRGVGSDPMGAVECARTFIEKTRADNEQLRSFFQDNYSKYM